MTSKTRKRIGDAFVGVCFLAILAGILWYIRPQAPPHHPAVLLDRLERRGYACADLATDRNVAICTMRDGSVLVLSDNWSIVRLARPLERKNEAPTRLAETPK